LHPLQLIAHRTLPRAGGAHPPAHLPSHDIQFDALAGYPRLVPNGILLSDIPDLNDRTAARITHTFRPLSGRYHTGPFFIPPVRIIKIFREKSSGSPGSIMIKGSRCVENSI